MGLIYILRDKIPFIIAYGGYRKTAKYFKESYDALVSLALLSEGTLHFMMMDEDTWQEFSCYANYLSTR